jgi:ATP-dependent Lhr-like helicase
VLFPGALGDPSWTDALVTLVKTDRARSIEVRKIDGNGLADAPERILQALRSAGFVDGYRGLTHRG